ncbi:hydroxyisourate hydrolase [Labrys okinawensis]|uniref:hydroxyisourate hydrolase n=1 Tax=Labrys okinawensis TaxID=346911 RepID=UPI0039BD8D44
MGRLSTHVLDIGRGKPAAGVTIELQRLEASGGRVPVVTMTTNTDGRTDQPLMAGEAFIPGVYELVFHIGAYFRGKDTASAGDFLDVVPIRVTLSDKDGHYHVPLVCSPFAYSTYRGS